MKPEECFRLRIWGTDTAYLELRDHPHKLTAGITARSVYLHELIDDYDGPRLRLDFDKHGRPIGLDILYPLDDHDGEMVEEPIDAKPILGDEEP